MKADSVRVFEAKHSSDWSVNNRKELHRAATIDFFGFFSKEYLRITLHFGRK